MQYLAVVFRIFLLFPSRTPNGFLSASSFSKPPTHSFRHSHPLSFGLFFFIHLSFAVLRCPRLNYTSPCSQIVVVCIFPGMLVVLTFSLSSSLHPLQRNTVMHFLYSHLFAAFLRSHYWLHLGTLLAAPLSSFSPSPAARRAGRRGKEVRGSEGS